MSQIDSDDIQSTIQEWVNLQTEKGLETATIKTVRQHIKDTFSVPGFSREEKDLIRLTTVTAMNSRKQQEAYNHPL